MSVPLGCLWWRARSSPLKHHGENAGQSLPNQRVDRDFTSIFPPNLGTHNTIAVASQFTRFHQSQFPPQYIAPTARLRGCCPAPLRSPKRQLPPQCQQARTPPSRNVPTLAPTANSPTTVRATLRQEDLILRKPHIPHHGKQHVWSENDRRKEEEEVEKTPRLRIQ